MNLSVLFSYHAIFGSSCNIGFRCSLVLSVRHSWWNTRVFGSYSAMTFFERKLFWIAR